MANGAVSYLGGTPSATPRYTTWFGSSSSTGWNTAKTHFAAIKDVYDTKPRHLGLRLQEDVLRLRLPEPAVPHLRVQRVLAAPLTGTDSKGGTLIHEMSHFNVVAGTDDQVYGQSGAKSLAISDPTRRSTTRTATSTSPRTRPPSSSRERAGEP